MMDDELRKALQTALDFEKKGHDIYEERATNTKNPLVAKTFRYLAEQELNHIDEIEEYMEQEKIELKGDKKQETEQFFSTSTQEFKEKTELSQDDVRAHETALKLEKDSYEFYKKQFDSTEKKDLQRFFLFLMEQERAHYELVNKAYEYIKDPEGFFSREEDWFFEG